MDSFYRELCECAGEENISRNEEMKLHTTFRIGGPADYFVMPVDEKSMIRTVQLCRQSGMPFCVIGNGSNLLVGDGGYRGVIIQLFHNWNRINASDTLITAQSGAMLSSIARTALSHSLTGFEFASGIPGTLGGAVIMNAGAYGGEMKDVVLEVEALTSDGTIVNIPGERMQFGYRTSRAATENLIVLSARLSLQMGSSKEILERMEELKNRRVSKQPLDLPSAGSTFKRPEGYFAGKLIMDANLAGYTVGGAQVSEKHCGFVVNRGGATARDVRQLMSDVQRRVYDLSGVTLEPEVKMLGEFV